MTLLYNISIRLYFCTLFLASFFNKKAKLWINGRRNQTFIRESDSIWFHFASLGEFEQGRPVLEQLKALYPANKVIITFFSPSGYQVRKNTPLADAVYYLPLDTPGNARGFIEAVQPKFAVFTKYEYWYHFLRQAHCHKIPVYIISGIFRPGQIFFKWYGGLHRKMLSFVNHFFVQDEHSRKLLQQIGVADVTVSGDTRFDRVWANAQRTMKIPAVEAFKNRQKLFIAGSTWPQDEKLIATLASQYPHWKFMFAPHEVNEARISGLMENFAHNAAIRYSQLTDNDSRLVTHQILIIDNVGMLSSLYQYGDLAYIGGGFGAGIHNTLEAAAFGLPVIFGPEYAKFKEARDLIELNAGFSITDQAGLKAITASLIDQGAFYRHAADHAKKYVETNTGATKSIVDFIFSAK